MEVAALFGCNQFTTQPVEYPPNQEWEDLGFSAQRKRLLETMRYLVASNHHICNYCHHGTKISKGVIACDSERSGLINNPFFDDNRKNIGLLGI